MIAFLRSILFALFFYPGSVIFVASAFPAARIGPRAVAAVTHGWSRYHRICARIFLGVKRRIEGAIPRGAVIVAPKHQSMYETIEMLILLDHPVLVMKRELAELPGWGWVGRQYGIISVDRAGGASALRTLLKEARIAIDAGRPIVIFPEGTRVLPGDHPPLQPGFAGLYRALGLPVIPVALDSGKVWPRGRFVKRPGTITFRFQDMIAPGLPRDEIEARVHRAINALDA